MKGRLYDARLGRFVTPDPFVTEPLNPQGLNRYAYVNNNPLNFVDPSGFDITVTETGSGGQPMTVQCTGADADMATCMAALGSAAEAEARAKAEAEAEQKAGEARAQAEAAAKAGAPGPGSPMGQPAINNGGGVAGPGEATQGGTGPGDSGSRIRFAPEVSDEFIAEFNRAVRHLGPAGARVLSDLEQALATKRQYLFIRPGLVNKFAPGSNFVDWDPHKALRIDGKGASPALAVLHELAHAVRAIADPAAYRADVGTPDDRWDNLEDKRVITSVENPAAASLGEAVRPSYSAGEYYYVPHADLVE